MTCEEIKKQNLIEAYVLNTLNESREQDIEQHLRECDSCRAEYNKERALISGIRDHSRTALKEEIRRQVRELKQQQSHTDWTLIYKIAAVLFVMVLLPGLLYYQYQFAPLGEVSLPFTNQKQQSRVEKPFVADEEMDETSIWMEESEKDVSTKSAPLQDDNVLPAPRKTAAEKKAQSGVAVREKKGKGMVHQETTKKDENISSTLESTLPMMARSAEPPAPAIMKKEIAGDEEAVSRVPAQPSSEEMVLSGNADRADKRGIITTAMKPVSIRLGHLGRQYEITMISNTRLPEKKSTIMTESIDSSRFRITWFVEDSLLTQPVNEVHFSFPDSNSILSRFPDSSRYLLKLAPVPEIIHLRREEHQQAVPVSP